MRNLLLIATKMSLGMLQKFFLFCKLTSKGISEYTEYWLKGLIQRSTQHAQLPLKGMWGGTSARRSQWEVTLLSIPGSDRDTGAVAVHACQKDRHVSRGSCEIRHVSIRSKVKIPHCHTTVPSVVIYFYTLSFTRALQWVHPQLHTAWH